MSSTRKSFLRSLALLFCVSVISCALVAAQTESQEPKDADNPQKTEQAGKQENTSVPEKPKESDQTSKDAETNYWIGIQIVPVPELLLSHFGMKDEDGSLIAVERVLPEGPAEKGGVQRGDVVQKFGGKPIRSLPELIDQVNKSKGAATPLEVIRDGAPKTITVTPIPRPEEIPNIPGVFNLRAMPRMQQQFNRRPPNPLQGQDQQQWMRDMEEFFRQMQGGADNEEMLLIPKGPNAPNLPGTPDLGGANVENGKKLSVSKQTINGKTTIKVTQTTQKNGQVDVKKWEVENIDELPEEIRGEVQMITGQ